MNLQCTTAQPTPEYEQIVHGTIAYPFGSETNPLGKNGPEEKFVIKSSTMGSEYEIQIPGAARDYDVAIPIAQLGEQLHGEKFLAGQAPPKLSNPTQTDKELVSSLPQLDKVRPQGTSVLDAAFGVGKDSGPTQSPSYSLGIAKVNSFYKKKMFEYAIIEINNLLNFYPNSVKLLKMKGTVYLKMRNYKLAEQSWIKALQLAPNDLTLKNGLARLQYRIKQLGLTEVSMATAVDVETPPSAAYEPKFKDGFAQPTPLDTDAQRNKQWIIDETQ